MTIAHDRTERISHVDIPLLIYFIFGRAFHGNSSFFVCVFCLVNWNWRSYKKKILLLFNYNCYYYFPPNCVRVSCGNQYDRYSPLLLRTVFSSELRTSEKKLVFCCCLNFFLFFSFFFIVIIRNEITFISIFYFSYQDWECVSFRPNSKASTWRNRRLVVASTSSTRPSASCRNPFQFGVCVTDDLAIVSFSWTGKQWKHFKLKKQTNKRKTNNFDSVCRKDERNVDRNHTLRSLNSFLSIYWRMNLKI